MLLTNNEMEKEKIIVSSAEVTGIVKNKVFLVDKNNS